MLAHSAEPEQFLEQAKYYSPEQAGSIDHDITQSTDLYSAGVVLFECLAGRPPFSGTDLNSVLFSHMTAAVPELRSLGLKIPRALDEVIQRLLRKDPRDRYQSAEAALSDLEAIEESLKQGNSEPSVVIGASDLRRTLIDPAFVSRDRELEAFDEQIANVEVGNAGLVFLEGESGGGKSRLLTEVTQRATKCGFRVLRGIGTNDVAQHPFGVLDGVFEKFFADCKTEAGFLERIKETLVDERDVLAESIPEISSILGTTKSSINGPEVTGEMRTIRALVRFLSALGTKEKPALVILDDCQWADDLTYKLIRHWQSQHSEETPPYVLLVVAFRSEEVASTHSLRQIAASTHLELSPFGPAEIRLLAESMAGRLPEEALEIIVQLSGGSPFMSSAVLYGLVESGALVFEQTHWRLESLALGHIHSSEREATFLARRLNLLSDPVLEYLSAGAVIGNEFDIQIAAVLTGFESADAISSIDVARQRQLIWCRPDGVTCVFVHDKIRQALLERLTPPARQALHLSAARYFEEHFPEKVSELAYHFDAAGVSDKAFHYALIAAEQARGRYALETAEQQYQIARRGAKDANPKVQYRVAEGLGDVLMLRGKYEAAGRLFDEASRLASDAYTQAQIRGKLAELSFKRGDMERAVEDYEQALRSLKRWIPGCGLTLFIWMLWEVVVQVFHTWLPRLFVHRRSKPPSDSERLAIRLFSGLAHGNWYCRGSLSTMWAHLRGLNLAERYKITPELGNAYSEHAPVMSLLGMFGRAVNYAEKSLKIRRELGDLWGQGQSLHYYGVVLYAASRYSECIDRCRESVRLLERMGDYWQLHIARYQIAVCYYRLGDFPVAIEECQRNHRSGIDLGDEQASGIILDVWARAALGKVPEEFIQTEMNRERTDAQGQAQVHFAAGVFELYQGDAEKAARTIEGAIQIVNRAGICNFYTLPLLAWAVTAYRRQAELFADYTPNRRNKMIRIADKAARRARRSAWRCQNDLPHILREQALIKSLQGRKRLAKKLFLKSLQAARRLKSRYEYVLTLDSYTKVGEEFSWKVHDHLKDKAKTTLAEFQIHTDVGNSSEALDVSAPSLSLIDRFDTVLESGRRIATGLSETSIYQETCSAACRLLRVHHGVILEVQPDRPVFRWKTLAGRLNWEISESVVEQSLASNRSLAGQDSGLDNDNPHAADCVERSALSAPLYVRGKAVACLYVMHPEIRGLFGRDEERLADFLATIAGAALENAEGFAELQNLNVTLEERVAERTAAAEARSRELAASNLELERIAQELRIAQVELSASKQAAEAASEAKSRFLATMSHEIRTPMNGILGMAELTLGSRLTDRQRGYLVTLKDSANALLTLLNDLLDFSKIEAGKMELESIGFSLRDVILDASRLLAIPAGRKGLDLVCRIEPGVPDQVIGDPNRLRQVLVNLLGNAIKFTAEGEVVVHAAAVKDSENKPRLRISVKDTGIGIPADKQHWIFEAFHQTDSSVTRRFGGTGLGLAICSQLIQLMEGSICVESREGGGTEFFVDIPLTQPIHEVPLEIEPFAGDRPIHVLSDHPGSRAAICELLDYLGLAHEILNPAEPIRFPEARSILLVDVSVRSQPMLDKIVETIFNGAHDPEDLICLLPAGQSDLITECEALEVEQLLVKPVKPLELHQAIRKVSERHTSPASREEAASSETSQALRILVADDSPVNREVAMGMLELCGHEVQTVVNGEEAVRAVREQNWDLVFMDLEMPVMDGLAATRTIRGLPNSKAEVLIYAMTAHAFQDTNQQCLDAGMDGYITKPIMPDQLMELLGNLPVRTCER